MSVDRWPRDRKLAPTRPAAPSVSSLASTRSVGSTPSAIDEEDMDAMFERELGGMLRGDKQDEAAQDADG